MDPRVGRGTHQGLDCPGKVRLQERESVLHDGEEGVAGFTIT